VADLGHSYYQVERDRQMFTLYTVNLDNGMQYEVGGRWLDADHPLVQQSNVARSAGREQHNVSDLGLRIKPAA